MQKDLVLTLEQAEKFVDENEFAWWEGWELVLWKHTYIPQTRNPKAYYNRSYRGRNKWGTAIRVAPSNKGLYRVPTNSLKPTRKRVARQSTT